MSLEPEISLAAREWFLAWLLEYLATLEPAGQLEPETHTTQAGRLYGQFGGGRLTGRQSNLTSRPGQRHTTVLLGGQRYAVGDTKKQYTRPILPPQNSPVVVSPMPYQPYASRALAEFAPSSYLLFPDGEPEPVTESAPIWDVALRTFRYMLPEETLKVMSSGFFKEGGALPTWQERHWMGVHVLPNRPYMLGYNSQALAKNYSAIKKTYWEDASLTSPPGDAPWEATEIPVPYAGNALFFKEEPSSARVFNVSLGLSEPLAWDANDVPSKIYAEDTPIGTVTLQKTALDFMPYRATFTEGQDWVDYGSDFNTDPFMVQRDFWQSNYVEVDWNSSPLIHEFTCPGGGFDRRIRHSNWGNFTFYQSQPTNGTNEGVRDAETPQVSTVLYAPPIQESISTGGVFGNGVDAPAGSLGSSFLGCVVFASMDFSVLTPEQITAFEDLLEQNPGCTESWVTGEQITNPSWTFPYVGRRPTIEINNPNYEDVTYTGTNSLIEARLSFATPIISGPGVTYSVSRVVPMTFYTFEFAPTGSPDDPRPPAQLREVLLSSNRTGCEYRYNETGSASASAGWTLSAKAVGNVLTIHYEPASFLTVAKDIRLERLTTRYFGEEQTPVTDWEAVSIFSSGGSMLPSFDDTPTIASSFSQSEDDVSYRFDEGLLAEEAEFQSLPDFGVPVRDYWGEGEDDYSEYTYALDLPSSDHYDAASQKWMRVWYTTAPGALKWDVDNPPPNTLPLWKPSIEVPGVFPLTTTELHRKELNMTQPYLYGTYTITDINWETGEFSFGAVPGDFGALANPLTGVKESSWFGLTWTAQWYVCDAFRADLPDAEGNLVEKTVAVALVQEPETGTAPVFTVLVSIDSAPVGSWNLWDFFPGAAPTGENPPPPSLSFLDSSIWPPAGRRPLEQHYNFLHPDFPFKGVALLTPFTARVRNPLTDKVGTMFTAAATDCPITLYLESFPDRDG